jgi:hypothetical protein
MSRTRGNRFSPRRACDETCSAQKRQRRSSADRWRGPPGDLSPAHGRYRPQRHRALLHPTALAALVIGARLSRGGGGIHAVACDARRPATAISVVVPARDEERRLPASLAALAQDGNVTDLIVFDDRSTDATATVAAQGMEPRT